MLLCELFILFYFVLLCSLFCAMKFYFGELLLSMVICDCNLYSMIIIKGNNNYEYINLSFRKEDYK